MAEHGMHGLTIAGESAPVAKTIGTMLLVDIVSWSGSPTARSRSQHSPLAVQCGRNRRRKQADVSRWWVTVRTMPRAW